MNWLAPMMAIYAAAAAVPLLVALYFLKLRRQSVPISSTLLWKRAVRDLQVNSPFQKLRRNILLLLQLLILLALLAALGRPVMSLTTGPARRYVLLIDRSASMNATDGNGASKTARLEAAKAQAREIVHSMRAAASLSLTGGGDQAMVVAFDENAKVVCNFTGDKAQLDVAIDSIEPCDGLSSLSQALAVARAFAQSPGVDANNRSSETPAQLELFSDGKIQDLDKLSLDSGELRFHSIGASGKNVAITIMQASRNYEKPEEVEVFACLANYNSQAVTCDVQMSLDGNIRAVRSVQIPPAKAAGHPMPEGRSGQATTAPRSDGLASGLPALGPPGSDAPAPGTTTISFSLTHAKAGVVEVRHLADASINVLASDDAAWSVVPPPKALRALLVTPGNPALESALRALLAERLAALDIKGPAEFDALLKTDQAALSANPQWDVIILDRYAPAKLPRGQYLVFGRAPAASAAQSDQEIQNQSIIDWRSQHPALQYVNLSNLLVARCYKLVLPPDAQVLAEFEDSAALALTRREGSTFLLAPFDCMETNWPFEPSFILFCYNAVNFLGLECMPQQNPALKVNQPIVMEGLPSGLTLSLSGPGVDKSGTAKVSADPSGTIRFPGTGRVGLYSLLSEEGSPRPPARFAVNLLDAAESDIAPATQIAISGQTIASQAVRSGNTELWPPLVLLALVLACVEWLVYNLKMRL